MLTELNKIIEDQTLFIYLDPFGLKGTNFETLKEFLSRDSTKYSTELLINLSVPSIIRLSCWRAYNDKGTNSYIEARHEIITKALGGDYWKSLILDTETPLIIKQQRIVDEYISRLKEFLPNVGYCQVSDRKTLKYVIIFTSRHPDAQELMNDIMFKAYWEYIWKDFSTGTLFAEQDYQEMLPDSYYDNLEFNILEQLNDIGKIKRKDLWYQFTKDYFMQYHSNHFRKKISELHKLNKIDFDDTRGTGKLNDDSVLFMKKRNGK